MAAASLVIYFALPAARAATVFYVDQGAGVNSSATTGSESDPFKSIVYALGTMRTRNAPDPWTVYIRPGTYDADPAKPANEREIFPIELRTGLTLQGDGPTTQCVISGAFNPGSNSALIHGSSATEITIRNLTLTQMRRYGDSQHGGAIELVGCAGTIRQCIMENNSAHLGGGIWASLASGKNLDFLDNTMRGNNDGGMYVSGDYAGTMHGNLFQENTTGGGLYIGGGFHGEISANTFLLNVASRAGGAILIDNAGSLSSETGPLASGKISGNHFIRNRAVYRGGGLAILGHFEGEISDNVFERNLSPCVDGVSASQPSQGGGFFIGGNARCPIVRNQLIGNYCHIVITGTYPGQLAGLTSGAGFHIEGNLVGNVDANTFEDNKTSGSFSVSSKSRMQVDIKALGGGFCVGSGLTGNVSSNLFKRNSAWLNGTGTLNYDYVDRDIITSSTACGGGFYVKRNIAGAIDGNTFFGNAATANGITANDCVTGDADAEIVCCGGGFFAGGRLDGIITGNNFAGNGIDGTALAHSWNGETKANVECCGGGFYTGQGHTGDIAANVFIGNSIYYSSLREPRSGQVGGTAVPGGGALKINGPVIGHIAENRFEDNAQYSIDLKGDVTGNILNNDMIRDSGLVVAGDLRGTVQGNTCDETNTGIAIRKNLIGKVLNNLFYGSEEGGMDVSESLTGMVSGNIFTGSMDDHLRIGGDLTGDLVDNVFSGSGFSAHSVNGAIARNVFSGNVTGSGAVYIRNNYEAPFVPSAKKFNIYNNYFLHNISSTYASLNSKQDFNAYFNLFSGDPSAISVQMDSSAMIMTNNIFTNLKTAIREEGKPTPRISNNDFRNVTDILNRDGDGLGNDAAYVDLLVSSCVDNHDWAPGFAGEAVTTGTWTADAYYDPATSCTVFTDTLKNWPENSLPGALINLAQNDWEHQHFMIVRNTANQILVRGKLAEVGFGRTGDSYSIDDYRLSGGSQNVDAGTTISISDDFMGNPRPAGRGYDIGPSEFQPLELVVVCEHGQARKSPDLFPYPPGTVVTVTVTPDANYRFACWTGDVPAGKEHDNPLQITINARAQIVANFTPITGSLGVIITPPEAVASGAKWRRAGTSAWLDSGTTEPGIFTGSYEIECNDITGWIKPATQNATISENKNTIITTAYAPKYITATLNTAAGDPVHGPFTVGAKFSEPVTGFTAEDLVTSNATVAHFNRMPLQSICASNYHSVAIDVNKALVTWGSNIYGQCDMPAGEYAAAAAGYNYTLALKTDGTLVARGYNTYGQCDVPAGSDFVAIAAGGSHNVAIRSNGSLAAWGWNTSGQCNVPAGNNYVAVAAGDDHSLALKSDGSVVAWGSNARQQCNVPSGNNISAIAAAGYFSMALKEDGSLAAWGDDSYGQRDVPGGNDFVAIACDTSNCLALRQDGSLIAWGSNYFQECNVPKGNNFVAIASGYFYHLALKNDGTLIGWGLNEIGQCSIPAGLNIDPDPNTANYLFELIPVMRGTSSVQIRADAGRGKFLNPNSASNQIQRNYIPIGAVTVDVTPDTAAWSFTDGGGGAHSGTGDKTLSGMPAGLISMTWQPLADYDSPAPNPAAKTLGADSTIQFTGVYTRQLGSVAVNVTPATVAWSLTDGAGAKHTGTGNDYLSNVPCGALSLTWTVPAGFDAPKINPVAKTLAKGGTAIFSEIFVASGPGPLRDSSRIVRYLLGIDTDPTGLDVNHDQKIDIADEIKSMNSVPPASPASPRPANGATNIPITTSLDWADCNYSKSYDVYLWRSSTGNRPARPTKSGLASSNYQPSGLARNTEYRWQVVAKNVDISTTGTIWRFTTGN